jgi:ABC-type antimicrobial peptide transport system permease subunit
MKSYILALAFIFSLTLSLGTAQAGISLGTGGITLNAGESMELCDTWIYAVQEGGTYHVETTGDIKPLTSNIYPNDFTLDPIDCPAESEARTACLADLCMHGDGSSCKIVCMTFTAPLLMDWSQERVEYSGGILNSMKIGVATVNEPFEFSVFVIPMSMGTVVTWVAAVIIIIIIIIALLLFRRKGKRRKR